MATTYARPEARAEIMRRLGDVQSELDGMSPSRLGSAWHSDRCAEVRALSARLESWPTVETPDDTPPALRDTVERVRSGRLSVECAACGDIVSGDLVHFGHDEWTCTECAERDAHLASRVVPTVLVALCLAAFA